MDAKTITNTVRAYFAQEQMTMAQVAERLGVTPPAVTNQLNGRIFSTKMARKYADEFGFSMDYLLTGKGSLLASEMAADAEPENTVPLVPFTVRGGTLQDYCDGATVWDCEPIISPVKGAELAFEVSGDSMAPAFPPGARVLLKKVRSDIMWGEIYVVDTEDGAVLKRVFPTDDEGVLELRSENPAYPPVRIPTAHIRGVWRVLLRMIQ